MRQNDQGDLTSLDWNHDGTLLAIGSYDSMLRVCTPTGEIDFALTQHEVSPWFSLLLTVLAKSHPLNHCLGSNICHQILTFGKMASYRQLRQYRWHLGCPEKVFTLATEVPHRYIPFCM